MLAKRKGLGRNRRLNQPHNVNLSVTDGRKVGLFKEGQGDCLGRARGDDVMLMVGSLYRPRKLEKKGIDRCTVLDSNNLRDYVAY